MQCCVKSGAVPLVLVDLMTGRKAGRQLDEIAIGRFEKFYQSRH